MVLRGLRRVLLGDCWVVFCRFVYDGRTSESVVYTRREERYWISLGEM